MSDPTHLQSISALAPATDVWFVDIWGVMHNGVAPFASAVDACVTYRRSGGRVILISNSPRLRDGVKRQLDGIGVTGEAYDDIVTSGDVSRQLIAAWSGKPVFHIGPERDKPTFEGLGLTLVPVSAAHGIVCTGLFNDERETPASYRAVLERLALRHVPMICANPDKTVLRAGRTIPCAGAVAEAYESLGGLVRYAGKPYGPIYDAAFALSSGLLGRTADKTRALAIGDGVATDIEGAVRAGLRSVFIAGGLHVRAGEDVVGASAALFSNVSFKPDAVMRQLAW